MVFTDLFKAEAARGENTLDTMYEIGLMDKMGTRIITPDEGFNVNEISSMSSRSLELTDGNEPLDNLPIKMTPVNGLPYMWMFGKATDMTTYVKVEVMTSGHKPAISVFTKDFPDNNPYEAFGCVLQTLDEAYEENAQMAMNLSFMGMEHGLSTATPTNGGFLDDINTPFDQFFAADGFKWGSNYYEIKTLTRRTSNVLMPIMGDDGWYIEISENSPIRTAWTVVFKEGVDISAIRADMKAHTIRTIISKIWKSDGSGQYIEFQQTNAFCHKIVRTQRIQGQPTRYVGMFIGEVTTINIKDGINKSNYGL